MKTRLISADHKILRQLPNSVTMLGLAFGVSSLNMAYWQEWKMAVFFILLAAVFDFLDGKVARLLGVTSRFGMELDSLSDFVSFGVSPGFLMYRWTLNQEANIQVMEDILSRSEAIGVGWGIVLFMILCCASRLARFNTMSDEKLPACWKHFFVGVPAPAGAGITTFPLMLWLANHESGDIFRSPLFVGFFLIASGLLMAGKIPTVSFKHLRLPAHSISVFRVAVIALIAGTFCFPWWMLAGLCVVYMATIPVGFVWFLKIRRDEAFHDATPSNDTPDDTLDTPPDTPQDRPQDTPPVS